MLPFLAGNGCVAARKNGQSPQVISVAQNSRFKIIEARQEAWKAGIAGAQGDTEYIIGIQLMQGAEIHFQHLYLNGRQMPVSIQNAAGRISTAAQPPHTAGAQQTLWLHSSASAGKPDTRFQNRQASHPNEAILSYQSEGEVFYHALPPFTIQHTPNRP